MKAFFDDIYSLFKTNPRTTALRQLARKKGWRFDGRERFTNVNFELQQMDVFQGKGELRLLNILRLKEKNARFRFYDFVQYLTYKNKTTSILEFRQKDLQLPHFSIRPKGTFDSFKSFFSTSKKTHLLPTTPDFDEKYELIFDDEKAMKNKLPMSFFDEIGDEADWYFEGNKDYIVAYKVGEQTDLKNIERQVQHFTKMCAFINKK